MSTRYEEPWWRRTLSTYLPTRPTGTRYSYSNASFGRNGRRRIYRDEYFSRYNPHLRTDDDPGAQRDTFTRKLRVDKIDLNKDINRKNHPGSEQFAEHDVSNLVLRRGQTFQVTVTFNRPYDEENDKIIFQMTTGMRPKLKEHTLIRIPITEDPLTPQKWEAKQIASDVDDITFQIMPAADAIVGKYTLFIETTSKDSKIPSRRKHYDEIYILFNAWCEEDQVYMENEEERKEYVLNDNGLIYYGNKYRQSPKRWYFGQFERDSLRAAIHLLESSYLNIRAHGNVVEVLRALSAMANSNDNDGGVLTGNWSGDYSGGVSPTSWNGSLRILKQYMLRMRAVNYGQCWVFSGLLTTLCRTLGIPTRSVTNFESAHDSDFSCTVDQHVDAEGKPQSHMDDDSVWNFHVWNEAWLKRTDLPSGNDGWQAFDSTPQELSSGMMRCGPAPVSAVKRGDVYLGYDTLFVFAEVNGDKLTWQVGENGDTKVINLEGGSIGCYISTKAVGKDERLDITASYKYPEGSEEERAAVSKASSYGNRKEALSDSQLYQTMNKDVSFVFKHDMKATGDIDFTVTATNTSNETRIIDINMHTVAKYYTGQPGDDLGERKGKLELKPTESKDDVWHVKATEWMNSLAEDASIAIYITGTVSETDQVFNAIETLWLDKPDLTVTASAKVVKKNTPVDITVEFTNPLNVGLTNAVITLEGAGIDDKNIKFWRTIKPGESIKETIKVDPKRTGLQRDVIACLNSRQLIAIQGSVSLKVTH